MRNDIVPNGRENNEPTLAVKALPKHDIIGTSSGIKSTQACVNMVARDLLLLPSEKAALEEAARLQSQSKDALIRTQVSLEQTQQAGIATLQDLHAQRRHLEKIEGQGDRLHDQLDETNKLQRKLGTWFGGAFVKLAPGRQAKKVDSVESDQKDSDHPNKRQKKKTKHSKLPFLKSSKKNNKEVLVMNVRKGLLDDVDDGSIPVEHQEDMYALAQGDKELDAQMDIIGNQLTDIINLAETIGTQTKMQGQQLSTVQCQMEDAADRQIKIRRAMRR